MKNNKNKNKNNRTGAYKLKPSPYVTTVQKPIFGFIEPRCLSTLKYNTVVGSAISASSGFSYKFKINSLFDPEDPVGGHQPYGFDTVSNIYSKYTVVKIRYEIEWSPSSDRLMVGVITSSQSPTAVTSLATYSLAAESPYSYSKALSFSGGPPARFTNTISLNAMFGITPQQLMIDDIYSASVTADPSQKAYLMVYAYNPTAAGVTTTCNVTLWMESVLFDPYLQNQS